MTANQFHSRLIDIVRPGTENALSWQSESDFPVEVVRLPDCDVIEWEQSTTQPYIVLEWQTGSYDHPARRERIERLIHAYSTGLPRRCYKRPTAEPSIYDLYLLVRFAGDEWVGLRTKLAET